MSWTNFVPGSRRVRTRRFRAALRVGTRVRRARAESHQQHHGSYELPHCHSRKSRERHSAIARDRSWPEHCWARRTEISVVASQQMGSSIGRSSICMNDDCRQHGSFVLTLDPRGAMAESRIRSAQHEHQRHLDGLAQDVPPGLAWIRRNRAVGSRRCVWREAQSLGKDG